MLENIKKKLSSIRKCKEEKKELERIKKSDWFKSTSSLMTRMDGFYKKTCSEVKETNGKILEYNPKTRRDKRKLFKIIKRAEKNANTNFIAKNTLDGYHHVMNELENIKKIVTNPEKQLKYVNLSPNPDPKYANSGDSGFDLRAWISQTTDGAIVDENSGNPYVEIGPHEVKLIHTGMYFDVPENCEIQARPRSGFALNVGLSLNNSPGTVDVGYTGEVGLICINPTTTPIRVYNGNKIAQAVLCPVYNEKNVTLLKVDKIEKDTERGSNGYGHSGL